MQGDPDYRDNQSRIQRAWHDRNPDYWREYRNRPSKREPHNWAPETHESAPVIPVEPAKMDASNCPSKMPSGLYWIEVLPRQGPGKSGRLIVEITPVCADCTCKKDACKYRT